MDFLIASQLEKNQETIILPFWEKKTGAVAAFASKEFDAVFAGPLQAQDFTGKEGEIAFVYDKGKRFVLVGLGRQEGIKTENFRIVFGQLTRILTKKKIKKCALFFPHSSELGLEESLKGVCEGILLANYKWSLKENSHEERSLEEVTLIGPTAKAKAIIEEVQEVGEAVYFARDLINGNADQITPEYLAQAAHGLSKQFPKLKTVVLNKKEIEKQGLGLLYAVGKGSINEPVLITLEYNGNPRSKEKTALVGKGITFDTGGLNLKTANMETMRDDMSGAACVLGTLAAAAALNLKVNLVGVVPSAENAIDAKSYKPGDVYKSYLGKTVEIGDTDAEGRLILADALAYSVKNLKPTEIIDFATLTGSVIIALGDLVTGLFSNNDQLAHALIEAGETSGELLWRMPLHQPYKEQLKSDIADLKNVGGRSASPIKAGLFLEEFVSKTPWAHLDIAGTAFSSKENGYIPKNAVGYGIRLMIDFLKKK